MKICSLKKRPDSKFAVKIMRVPDEEFFKIAMNEFTLLEEKLNHPNVVKAFDMFYNQTQEKIYMVQEFAGEGSNLESYVQLKKKEEDEGRGHLTEEIMKHIIGDILGGIAYLHS